MNRMNPTKEISQLNDLLMGGNTIAEDQTVKTELK